MVKINVNIDPIKLLLKEHEVFEKLLFEFSDIIKESKNNLDIIRLNKLFKKLYVLWTNHEQKEERFFPLIEKPSFKIHVEKMFFDHKKLKPHKDSLNNAILSCDKDVIVSSLEKHGELVIQELREHLDYENEYLFMITEKEYSKDELEKAWKDAGNLI
ncbi:hypothetical protein GOV12_07165 [Candidatus Pacearchaeota archaeon]|nr:hypothetical protein [Candidatus Pacearchaeota archaeon]